MLEKDYMQELETLKKVNVKTVNDVKRFLESLPAKYFSGTPEVSFCKKRFPIPMIVVNLTDGATKVQASFCENNKKTIINYEIKDADPLLADIRYRGSFTIADPGVLDYRVVAQALKSLLNQHAYREEGGENEETTSS